MRSGFGAFSLPITAPQLAMILSSSLAVRAAMQGAESICSSVGSLVAAHTADAAHTAAAVNAPVTRAVKLRRIDLSFSVVPAKAGTHTPRRSLTGAMVDGFSST